MGIGSADYRSETAEWELVLQIIGQKLQNESWFCRLLDGNYRMEIGSAVYWLETAEWELVLQIICEGVGGGAQKTHRIDVVGR